jgi:hypothetical protein
MSIDSKTQARLIGLAEGLVLPQTGMEIHFIRVCRGESIPCSRDEIEWFDFVEKRRSVDPESDFTFRRGLPGMAELDEMVEGVGLFRFPDLTDVLTRLSETYDEAVDLLERTSSLGQALAAKASAAADEGAHSVFRERTDNEVDAKRDAVRQLRTGIAAAQATLCDLRNQQDETQGALEALNRLDRQLRERLGEVNTDLEKRDIREQRERVRLKFESLVPVDKDLIESIRGLVGQTQEDEAGIAQIEQEIRDLADAGPIESDRALAYKCFMSQNDSALARLKHDLAVAQDRLATTKGEAFAAFVSRRSDLAAERVKLKMSPGRRRTYKGLRSMPAWGEYRSDWADFEEVLSDNDIERLYHFTDTRNLDSIRQHGGLYSWRELERRGITIPFPGGDDISRNQDTSKGLQDYVRLSFARKQPMLTMAEADGRIDKAFHLEISPDVILFSKTKFANTNAASNMKCLNVGTRLSDLKLINFSVFKDEYWNLDTKVAFQAEILVPKCVPKEFILNWSSITHGG